MADYLKHVVNPEGIDYNFFRANLNSYLPEAVFMVAYPNGYEIMLPPDTMNPFTPEVEQAMRSASTKWAATEPRLNRWFISDEGIARAVITADIKRYLGPDAWVEPGHDDAGNSGYWIVAYRTLTSSMVEDIKEDTILWLDHVASKVKRQASNDAFQSSTPVPRKVVVEDVAEKCGWQVGAEKFLWTTEPSTALFTTERGFLGRGSIGEVEEVAIPGYTEVMARKRIFVSRLKQQAARERQQIQKEIEHLKSLDHKHIIKVVGSYQESKGKSTFTICALLYPSGDEDLGVFLHEVYFNASYAERWTMYHPWMMIWFHCLASALAYMHAQGIHHEDIKPSNIVHRKGTVFFTDFSSSRKLESENETSTASPALASRMFAAPEVFSGDAGDRQRHGSQTDVFSLGLVFMEMYVVLCHSSIKNLHNHLFKDTATSKQYHRVIDKFDTFWPLDFAPGDIQYLRPTLRSMLLLNRRERPKASEVEKMLWTNRPNLSNRNISDCKCRYSM